MLDKTTEVLEIILKALTDKPEEVKIERKVDEMGILLTVKLGEGDAGFVIGKQGKTINLIRDLMTVIGAKNRARVSLKLDVPAKESRMRERESIF